MPHQAHPCRCNADGTPFQYGWNSVPVRVELGSSRDGTRTGLSIGPLRIFIIAYFINCIKCEAAQA